MDITACLLRRHYEHTHFDQFFTIFDGSAAYRSPYALKDYQERSIFCNRKYLWSFNNQIRGGERKREKRI